MASHLCSSTLPRASFQWRLCDHEPGPCSSPASAMAKAMPPASFGQSKLTPALTTTGQTGVDIYSFLVLLKNFRVEIDRPNARRFYYSSHYCVNDCGRVSKSLLIGGRFVA